MTTPDFGTLITAFFVRHLATEHNASPHTAKAYRDALKLLLRFAADDSQRPVAALQLDDLTSDLILRFLTHLETTRRNTVRTRNARLAAIHSFFHYVLERHPECALTCQRVLAIPIKKTTRPLLGYLTDTELAHLLAQIDRTTLAGERDYLLLALLYDTGARIQELLDLRPSDLRVATPAVARLHGKGRRERLCPLLPKTARLISRYLARVGRPSDDDGQLFCNRYGQPLKRHGARYLLMKYLTRARTSMPGLRRSGISPHTIRHTKAMHLLQAGVPLITIKDVLGHADVKSTEVYVQIDVGMKREALNLVGSPTTVTPKSRHLSKDLLQWLESL